MLRHWEDKEGSESVTDTAGANQEEIGKEDINPKQAKVGLGVGLGLGLGWAVAGWCRGRRNRSGTVGSGICEAEESAAAVRLI